MGSNGGKPAKLPDARGASLASASESEQQHEDRPMPQSKRGNDRNLNDPRKNRAEHTEERSSPGSGEDVLDEAADVQPNDVENGDTAR